MRRLLHSAAAALLVEGAVDGRPATFVLDTGAEATFLRAAHFAPLTSDRSVLHAVRVGSGFAGAFLAKATRARSLEVGPHASAGALLLSAPEVDAELDRLGALYGRELHGFLGNSFLREFEVFLAESPRALGLRRFDAQGNARQYMALYEEMLTRRRVVPLKQGRRSAPPPVGRAEERSQPHGQEALR